MEMLRTIRDMAVRAWRMLSPHHTGEVQSWREMIRALEARGYRPNEELLMRQTIARRRARDERAAANEERKRQAAANVRAKFGCRRG